MLRDWWRAVIRRIGHPTSISAGHPTLDIDDVNDRLARIERTNAEMAARLRLLDIKADPKGIRHQWNFDQDRRSGDE